jgi:hypothetical protein
MRALGVRTLDLKESFYPPGYGSLYSAMKELVELQGFECLPTPDEGLGFDHFHPSCRYHINMDAWRSCRMRGVWHIMKSMAAYWQIRGVSPTVPWLKIDDVQNEFSRYMYGTGAEYCPSFSLWSLTPRWRQNNCDWRQIYHNAPPPGFKVFVGFPDDYKDFCKLVDAEPYYIHTPAYIDVVRLVRDATGIYCNQGFVLAAAQGLGRNYWCAFKNNKQNCFTRTHNEHYL